MPKIVAIVDFISTFFGKLSAWLFFAVGLFVTFEVVMRYFFNMPTIWVDEVSRIFQVWAAFLASAYVLKNRDHIVIDVAFRNPESLLRKLTETFSIVVIVIFSLVVIWYGFGLWLKSTQAGHTTDTFLAVPKWITQGAIWVGFTLLLLQGAVEIWRIWVLGIPSADKQESR